jgi:hypothetical protein
MSGKGLETHEGKTKGQLNPLRIREHRLRVTPVVFVFLLLLEHVHCVILHPTLFVQDKGGYREPPER